jgi:hypothetical protein
LTPRGERTGSSEARVIGPKGRSTAGWAEASSRNTVEAIKDGENRRMQKVYAKGGKR